jgi:hypothetical protein
MRLGPTLTAPVIYGRRRYEQQPPTEPNPYFGLAFSLAFSAVVVYIVVVARRRP